MHDASRKWNHTYQLVFSEDGKGCAQRIEFEAPGPQAALVFAHRQCGGRVAELFEDGRSLGRLQNPDNCGFWIISPPAPEATAG